MGEGGEKKFIGKEARCWYRVVGGENFGPFSLIELETMLRRCEISGEENVVRQRSNGEWSSCPVERLVGTAPSSRRKSSPGPAGSFQLRRTVPLHAPLPLRQGESSTSPAFGEKGNRSRRAGASRGEPLGVGREGIKKRVHETLSHAVPLRNLWRRQLHGAAHLEKTWDNTLRPLLSAYKFPLLALGVVLLLAIALFSALSERHTRVVRYAQNTAPVAAAAGMRATPGKPSEPKGKGLLPGCPRGVANALELARSSTEMLTLKGIVLEENATGCAPCSVRARLPDGTPLALELRSPGLLPRARAGSALDVCGRLTARTAQRAWILVEKAVLGK